jgi:MinD-like ATPase involved in chromosome partitioning or flagellar assembly
MRTIAFYSYKGGTGRTLTVVNTARFLAYFGYRVVVLDFDLEAPGLHYKFGVHPGDQSTSFRGLVDLVASFIERGSVPDPRDYLVAVQDLPSGSTGSIDLLPAGNAPSAQYSRQLSFIRNEDLFIPDTTSKTNVPVALPLFLELKERILDEVQPDYLLIDSRTGITEIGGVALRLMSDTVVCLFHNNREDIAGARKVLRRIQSAPRPQGKQIEILPVLARVPETDIQDDMTRRGDIQGYLNKPGESPAETLAITEILALRSDPSLELTETILIGSPLTGNESVLLRDYYKLFLKLQLTRDLSRDQQTVLNQIASADQDPVIRRLVIGGRRTEQGAETSRIRVTDRIHKRRRPAIRIVWPAYAEGPVYGKFVGLVIENLKRAGNIEHVEEVSPHNVRWDLLALHLREGIVDFCADIYYLTENRAHFVDVVQLGWCHTFVAYARKGSLLEQHLHSTPAGTLEEFITSFASTRQNSIVAAGVLGETPAASEANRRLGAHIGADHLISKGSEEDLLAWLEKDEQSTEKIAFCDHVVAQKLNRITQASDRYSSDSTFRFANPIPLGIVYPREDHAWRKQIANAVASSLTHFLATERWDTSCDNPESVAQDFQSNNTEALPLADLRSSLLLDLDFQGAVKWNRQMEAILKRRTGIRRSPHGVSRPKHVTN